MTETVRYHCESQGHEVDLPVDAENPQCPQDRSKLIRVSAPAIEASQTPVTPAEVAVPASSGESLRPVREVRITFEDAIVSVSAGTQVLLGRDPEYSPHAGFFGRDTHVSRRHAVLGLERDGRAWIRDCYSTNLTMVSGEALKPGAERNLRDRDQVRLCAAVAGTVDLVRRDSDDT